MSLEQLAFAVKGIAHETQQPAEDVSYMLMITQPLLNATSEYMRSPRHPP